jgi:hypothetical protein
MAAMNPILEELNGMSPAAKAALMQAHSATAGQSTPPSNPMQGTQAPVPSLANLRAAPAAGPTPVGAGGIMPPPSGSSRVPSLSFSESAAPAIQAPRGTLEGDQNALGATLKKPAALESLYGRISNSNFGQNHPVIGKVLGTLAQIPATAADVVASGLEPRIGAVIPGTSIQRGMHVAGLQNQIKEDEASRAAQSAQAVENARIPYLQAQTEAANLVEISPEQAEEIGIPSLAGQKVTQGALQHLMTTAKTANSREAVANISAQSRQDIANANNLTKEKVASLKPEQRDDRAIRIMEKPADQRTQEENAYLGAYSQWVQQTKVEPGIARAQAFGMFRPVQVTGPNGDVHYEFSGNAIRSGASTPNSMSFRTAMGVARYMTSGKGGGTLTAYRTAYDHLDLLRQAANALNNGDVQTLNRMSNAFKEKFGHAAPTNFEAVKTMLAGEIANVAKATGATDQEIAAARDELQRAQSPEQINGVIETNQDLMDQKAVEMYQQYQSGMQGQPVFGHSAAAHPAGGNAPGSPPAATGGTAVSLSAAKGLPQNKGKTDAQIRADIEAHGHQVAP